MADNSGLIGGIGEKGAGLYPQPSAPATGPIKAPRQSSLIANFWLDRRFVRSEPVAVELVIKKQRPAG
jgi:hypothetical protein